MAKATPKSRKPDTAAILGGSRGAQNPSHDSPSRPGNKGHTVDVRKRVIKSPKSAPSEPNPKASVYQKPSKPVMDNQYPGMPHVDKKNMRSPKKEPTYIWQGVNVDIPRSKSEPKVTNLYSGKRRKT